MKELWKAPRLEELDVRMTKDGALVTSREAGSYVDPQDGTDILYFPEERPKIS